MPDPIVMDASAAIRAAIESEPGHEDAVDCLAAAVMSGHDVIAPDLFLYEVGHALLKGNLSPARRLRTLILTYEAVEIRRPSLAAFPRALTLAGEGKLSFYDAAYLALAEEAGGLLWTEDRELLKRFPQRTADTKELRKRLR